MRGTEYGTRKAKYRDSGEDMIEVSAQVVSRAPRSDTVPAPLKLEFRVTRSRHHTISHPPPSTSIDHDTPCASVLIGCIAPASVYRDSAYRYLSSFNVMRPLARCVVPNAPPFSFQTISIAKE
jgi:hypothetical protein